ncbi:carbon-nitrogen hydrolase family protein [Actinophytocola algeriensis]|uniref:Putative amidohydrolase n=1 Tax=Actinophytocola algeriensis TaxID=1768010 RepID=A0A7W7QBB0_9PSEU|nr:carbon-nitrogen hydrolase family protein [Actinophytocola algeriensis]MBB4910283.1 putative amidohydrolase [Actinophytocola algeriensis]MBE1480728.1 putative amidohydrolase [Actinophytocola algeriensis]
MRVALSQITSSPSPTENLELVAAQVKAAAADGASVVLFPEATMACFGTSLGPLAEPLDGPWATAVRAIAAEHDVLVVAGMFTPSPDGRVFNTLLATDRDRHVGYDKIHLYDAFGFQESRTVAPGDDLVVLGDLGVATCYDVRFPGVFTGLADKGASVVLLGASWGAGPGKREQWELLVRARALDSTCWVVACGQADPGARAGSQKAPTGIGYSLVAAPDGSVFASLGADPELLVVDLDLDRVAKVRETIPVLANRRI